MTEKPIFAFYGDDFTGSTDVMEALALNGIETVLFLQPPSTELMASFAHCRAFGLAGTSRSQTPDWMDRNLPAVFSWLKSLGAAHSHYKVCSTFDSSPAIGSIGRAADIGMRTFGQRLTPLIVGAPQLKRYTAFGNLFAAYQGQTYRIDRHPVMGRHPVTPMREADLRLHLEDQTDLPVHLTDLQMLASKTARQIADGARVLEGLMLIDVDDAESQIRAGALAAAMAQEADPFIIGSSGVEYALIAHWRERDDIGAPRIFAPPGKVDRIAVVSGSVSPTTERQIRHALDNGFSAIEVDPALLAGAGQAAATETAVQQAIEVLHQGQSPIIHTALGPSTDKGEALGGARHEIGKGLGRILSRLVEAEHLPRAVIAGGDTSSHALTELGVAALTTLLPLPATPGSPLCTAHDKSGIGKLQIALKGGQVGGDDYFSMIREGKAG